MDRTRLLSRRPGVPELELFSLVASDSVADDAMNKTELDQLASNLVMCSAVCILLSLYLFVFQVTVIIQVLQYLKRSPSTFGHTGQDEYGATGHNKVVPNVLPILHDFSSIH